MPRYEYKCKECGSIIEFQASMDKKEEMAKSLKCEECGSEDIMQVFGGVALTGNNSGKSEPSLPQGGGCCPGGMCGI